MSKSITQQIIEALEQRMVEAFGPNWRSLPPSPVVKTLIKHDKWLRKQPGAHYVVPESLKENKMTIAEAASRIETEESMQISITQNWITVSFHDVTETFPNTPADELVIKCAMSKRAIMHDLQNMNNNIAALIARMTVMEIIDHEKDHHCRISPYADRS